jgi:hypothetical protein
MISIRLNAAMAPGTVRKVGVPGNSRQLEFTVGKEIELPDEVAEKLLTREENGKKLFERGDGHDESDICEALGVQQTWQAWPSTLP